MRRRPRDPLGWWLTLPLNGYFLKNSDGGATDDSAGAPQRPGFFGTTRDVDKLSQSVDFGALESL